MADPVVTLSREVAGWPWLVRELTLTSGNTAAALTHGGPASVPDMFWAKKNLADPTATEIALYSPTTTTITVDCEGNAVASSYKVYLVWFNPSAAGGIG